MSRTAKIASSNPDISILKSASVRCYKKCKDAGESISVVYFPDSNLFNLINFNLRNAMAAEIPSLDSNEKNPLETSGIKPADGVFLGTLETTTWPMVYILTKSPLRNTPLAT